MSLTRLYRAVDRIADVVAISGEYPDYKVELAEDATEVQKAAVKRLVLGWEDKPDPDWDRFKEILPDNIWSEIKKSANGAEIANRFAQIQASNYIEGDDIFVVLWNKGGPRFRPLMRLAFVSAIEDCYIPFRVHSDSRIEIDWN